MPIIAKIIPNNITFESMTDADITEQSLLKLVQQLITFERVPDESNEMLQCIGELLDPPDDIRIRTSKCYESYDNMLFMMVCNHSVGQENKFCRYMSAGYVPVFGMCIMISTSYDKTGKIIYTDITAKQIVDMLLAKMVHTAIMITPNNTISTIPFSRLPIENSIITETNCRSIPIEFLGRNIVMFMEMQPTDDRLNLYATIIGKKQRVHGDVVITMISQYPMMETLSLNEDLFRKILLVMSNHQLSRKLTGIDNADQNSSNFYHFLEGRFKQCNPNINTIVPDDVLRTQTYNSTLHT